jgi:hypothetical protein
MQHNVRYGRMMVSVTVHGDTVTIVAEGNDYAGEVLAVMEGYPDWDIIDQTCDGVSCCIRLLSGYSEVHDTEDCAARSGEL